MEVRPKSDGESTSPAQTYSLSDEPRNDLDVETAEAERRLVRKLDLHIIPLIMALYLFSFLDR